MPRKILFLRGANGLCPSANSIEQHEAKILKRGETDQLSIAAFKWSTAEWAYEFWKAELFTGIYKELEKYRKSLPDTKSEEESYKNSVHQCMIAALKQMKERGFFKNISENVVIFISSSNDDEAFDLENYSAKELNSEAAYLSFIERYGLES